MMQITPAESALRNPPVLLEILPEVGEALLEADLPLEEVDVHLHWVVPTPPVMQHWTRLALL